jgi:undecaprenyl-diphosphatase
LYGYASSHAANVFGLATFLFFVLDQKFRILKYWMFAWATLVAYSRIYNGVHYPGDVITGVLIGVGYGYLLAKAYQSLTRYIDQKQSTNLQI